ncbi:hypothetical protein D9M72_564720 [compost metagenome]
MRGLRATVVGGVCIVFAASVTLLIFAVVLMRQANWVLGVTMMLGALVSIGADIGVLRGFRPVISPPKKEHPDSDRP